MMQVTHAVVGLVLGEILLLSTPLVVLGAVLPDIDFLIGLTHRGLTHSLLFLVLASLLVYKLRDKRAAFSLFIGLTSHLFLDAVTTMGIQALWSLNTFFSFNLTSTNYVPVNIFIIALLAVVYYNKESIIDYLTRVRRGVALKGSMAFTIGWSLLLIASPVIICRGSDSSINSLINNKVLNGMGVRLNGTICSSINPYYSKAGNEYQVFYICDNNESIKIFKGSWVLDNELRQGDVIYLCGTYTTDYGEPEVSYIDYVSLIAD